jgi:Uma2 family endonuclease
MPSTTRAITDDELMRLPKDGRKYELVDGELRVSPGAGVWHEWVVAALLARLRGFVIEHGLGYVFGSNLVYGLPSGNRRSPDVSFIAATRLPSGPELKELFRRTAVFELVPDLVVEVLSPSDRPREVMDKVGEYLGAGVRLAWVIDPAEERAVAYRSVTGAREIPPDGSLDGEDLLPGFRFPLRELFE